MHNSTPSTTTAAVLVAPLTASMFVQCWTRCSRSSGEFVELRSGSQAPARPEGGYSSAFVHRGLEDWCDGAVGGALHAALRSTETSLKWLGLAADSPTYGDGPTAAHRRDLAIC